MGPGVKWREDREKGVSGVIKDEKGGQIKLDMEEVKFYFYSSLKSVISPGARERIGICLSHITIF